MSDEPAATDYEAVPAGASSQVLGPNGRRGDYLERVIITVDDTLDSEVFLSDGGGPSISLSPTLAPVGVKVVEINAVSVTGAWQITTAALVSALAVGRFT
jgi:hypothetical protein